METSILQLILSFLFGIESSIIASKLRDSEKERILKNLSDENIQTFFSSLSENKGFIFQLIKHVETAIHESGITNKSVWITPLLEEAGVFDLHEQYIRCTDIKNKEPLKSEIGEKVFAALSAHINDKSNLVHVTDFYFKIIDVCIANNQALQNQINNFKIEGIEKALLDFTNIVNEDKDEGGKKKKYISRWIEKQRKYNNDLLYKINIHFDDKTYVDWDVLRKNWESFISGDNWKNIVKRKIENLDNRQGSLLTFHPDVQLLIEKLKNIDYSDDLSRLRRNFLKIIDKHYGKAIQSIISIMKVLRKEKKDLDLQIHRYFLSKLAEYASYCRDSKFEKCFCLIGSTGSGKSRFIYSLIEKANNDQESKQKLLFLTLNTIWGNNIEDTIKKAIEQHTDHYDIDTEEVFNYFNDYHNDLKLIIIIDDIGNISQKNSNFSYELQSAIEGLSNRDNIKWLITLKENLYDADADEWASISPYSYEGVNLESSLFISKTWYNLDRINERESIGIKVIRNSINIDEDDNLAIEMRYEEDEDAEYYYNLFCNPFIAKTLLAITEKDELMKLAHLSYVDIGEKLNSIIIQKVLNIPYGTADQGAQFIAEIFLSSHKCHVNSTKLKNNIISLSVNKSELENKEDTDSFCSLLYRNDILSEKYDKRLREYITQPKLVPFWSYRISKIIVNKIFRIYNNESYSFDGEIQVPIDDNDLILEGAVSFTLLHIENPDTVLNIKQIWNIWRTTIESHSVPNSAIFFALSNASAVIQRKCVNSLYFNGSEFQIKRDLFAFLHFTSNSRLKREVAVNALNVLCNNFKMILTIKLNGFFLYSLENLLEYVTDKEHLKSCLKALNGSEILGDNNEIAIIAMNKIKNICKFDSEKVLDFILDCLPVFNLENEQHSYDYVREVLSIKHARLFRDWLFFEVLDYIMQEYESEAFDVLIDYHWFSAKHPKRLSKSLINRMETEATIKFGYYYRNSSELSNPNDFRDSIDLLVKKLCSSKKIKMRRIGFYIIKHSIPKESYANRAIEPQLMISLKQLYQKLNDNNFISRSNSNKQFCLDQFKL